MSLRSIATAALFGGCWLVTPVPGLAQCVPNPPSTSQGIYPYPAPLGCVAEPYAESVTWVLATDTTIDIPFPPGSLTVPYDSVEIISIFGVPDGLVVTQNSPNARYYPIPSPPIMGCVDITGTPSTASSPDGDEITVTAKAWVTAPILGKIELPPADLDLPITIEARPDCAPLDISVNALLEGPYGGSGQMSTALNPRVPNAQPFDILPWSYPGSEVANPLPANAVDWLLMELRSHPSPDSSLVRQAVLLLSDGSVADTSGSAVPHFKGFDIDSAWVILHARNHLPVMSPQKVEVVSDTATHDFTSSLGAAFSETGPPLKNLGDGHFGMFGGDATKDGQVTAPDFNAWLSDTKAAEAGYLQTDFNMDGQVTVSDFNLWLTNTKSGASSQVPF